MWEPGTKVECIRDDWDFGCPTDPRVGGRYVVSRNEPCKCGCGSPFIGLHGFPQDITYEAAYFRPINDTRQLPECLTELLKTPKRESEPA